MDSTLAIPRRPWQTGEFVRQCWFIAKVCALPLVLISVPFGMIIALHAGSFFRQLGAESQIGSALLLATVREQAPIATTLLIAPRLAAATVCAIFFVSIVAVAGIMGGWYFAVPVHEPDSRLGPLRVSFLNELNMELKAELESTFVVVTHNIPTARNISDYIGMLFRRNLVMFGETEELFSSDKAVVNQFLHGKTIGPIGMSEEQDAPGWQDDDRASVRQQPDTVPDTAV